VSEPCTVVDLDDILKFTVDFGESDGEYAAHFRRLVKLVDAQLYPGQAVAPKNFPSYGLRGRHVCRVLLFRPGSVDSGSGLRAALVESGFEGRFLHPLELLALCANYRDLGRKFPLVSSPDCVSLDANGVPYHVMVSSCHGGQAVDASSPDGIGWSANCRFPIRLSEPG